MGVPRQDARQVVGEAAAGDVGHAVERRGGRGAGGAASDRRGGAPAAPRPRSCFRCQGARSPTLQAQLLEEDRRASE